MHTLHQYLNNTFFKLIIKKNVLTAQHNDHD